METEWDRFKIENEQCMKEEGIYDIDNLIEQSIHEYEEEEQLLLYQLEQEELEQSIALYEESLRLCINCRKVPLEPFMIQETPVAKCHQCGFYATEKCLTQVKEQAAIHDQSCQGQIGYALEPGTDNTLMAACDVCDLWDLFYM